MARSLQDEIIRLGWPLGHSLGTERELLDRLHVSRATLREAIRQLEGQGLADMRCGTGGGLIIAAPARTVAVRSLESYLELIDVGFEEVVEVRAILEGLAARLAAERLTDVGIEKLMTQVSERRPRSGTDLAAAISLDMQLRETIAELSGNPAIVMLIEATDRYAADQLLPVLSAAPSHQLEVARLARAHKRLIDAILKRDGDEAGRLSRHGFAVAGAYVAGALKTAPPAGSGKELSALPGKLGQRVAVGIAADIRRLPVAPGQFLGKEPELQGRYGVSRAVLREALRILELHGLAGTRRGNGGGIVAGTPDPSYTVESVALYLRFVRFSAQSVFEICSELQVAAIGFAVQRATEAEIEELRRILAAQAATPADLPAWIEVTARFHQLLIDLSHNRVIAAFIRALIAASVDTDMFISSPAAKAAYDRSHAAIVQALECRDAALAKTRMSEHIAAAMRQGRTNPTRQ